LYLDRCGKNEINIEKKNIKTANVNAKSFLIKYKKSFVAFLLLPFVIISSVLPIVVDPFEVGYTDLVIMSHRGSSLHGVENTLEAIEGAISGKADYVEIDVIQTKDNELVVIHDFNLKRLGKVNANISELTLNEIREITLKQGDFTGKISTLDEVIKLSKGKIKLNIEVKLHGKEEDFINKFMQVIKDNNFIGQCVVQSTNFPILKEIKQAEPKLKVGYIIYAGIPRVEFIEADFLTIEESLVTDKIIHASRLLNKPIYVWTVNSKSSMKDFYLLGVDGIITDDVPTAKEVIAEMKEK
jgi:glycerophosphoryl diester phosphodiesterase